MELLRPPSPEDLTLPVVPVLSVVRVEAQDQQVLPVSLDVPETQDLLEDPASQASHRFQAAPHQSRPLASLAQVANQDPRDLPAHQDSQDLQGSPERLPDPVAQESQARQDPTANQEAQANPEPQDSQVSPDNPAQEALASQAHQETTDSQASPDHLANPVNLVSPVS